jgi:hypothetical protein
MSNKAVNFLNFKKKESLGSFSKKEAGILGPFIDGTLKIKVSKNGNNDRISLDEDDENVTFNFKDQKISIPSKCISKKDLDSKSVITVKTDMNWFNDDRNSALFEDFIDYYLTSKISKIQDPLSQISDDLEILLDTLGLDSRVKKIHRLGQKSYECELENGYFVEILKKDDLNLFKKISFFKKDSDVHPCLVINKTGGDFLCKYKTQHCKYEASHDSIGDMLSSPMDSYLVQVCLGLDTEPGQKKLVDYLLKSLKYHTWKDNSNSKEDIQKNKKEHLEILQVMDALKNTIPVKHIEEMYSDARSKFYKR